MIEFSKAPMSRRFQCPGRMVTLETCRPIVRARSQVTVLHMDWTRTIVIGLVIGLLIYLQRQQHLDLQALS
jgi:hypothetical protein